MYSDGYYDFNTYQLYRELAEGITVTDTSEYLSGALGNSLAEISGFQYYPINSLKPARALADTTILGDIGIRHRPTLFCRAGYENRATVDNSYFFVKSQGEASEIYFKSRMRGSETVIERRALTIKNDFWDFTLGNYTADIGAGLGIGRYDYRPSNGYDGISEFLFPDNSYYNGVKIGYRNRIALIYSLKKYKDLDKLVYAAAASTNWRDAKIGLTSSATRLSSQSLGGSLNKSLGSASIFVSDPIRGFETELAYAESGIGIFSGLTLPSMKLKGWHYGKSYLNLQSSGMAYPDYTIYKLYEAYGFRQPQAGESGLYFERYRRWGKAVAKGALESWIVTKGSIDGSFLIQYPLFENFDINARFSGRGGAVSERYLYQAEFAYKGDTKLKFTSVIWSANGGIDHHKSLSQIYLMLPLAGSTLISGRIRFRFDGQTDFFLEERTSINDKFSLKATYRWRETDGGRLGPFFLVTECVL